MFDDYFGKDMSQRYGDIIAEKFAGKRISKKISEMDTENGLRHNGGLIGIGVHEMLQALEGMCYEGRAVEVDDSTYLIKG